MTYTYMQTDRSRNIGQLVANAPIKAIELLLENNDRPTEQPTDRPTNRRTLGFIGKFHFK